MIINKVIIEKGAIYDYEGIVCNIPLQLNIMRTKVEKLIDDQEYFLIGENLRIDYHDIISEKELLIFVKKGYQFGLMQTYIINGICAREDYDIEMESNGVIKEWLEVEID
jgi:hypothetical protein